MKKITKRMIGLLTVAVLVMAGVTGCGSSNGGSTNNSTQNTQEPSAVPEDQGSSNNVASQNPQEDNEADLSGAITMAGSTSMEKFCTALTEAIMEKYPDVTINAEYVGSSAGVESVISGSADIGNSSRALKDSEKESGAVENIVAIDGIAVVTDTGNTVTSLTKEQLIQIYTGEITNWSDLGGENTPIVVIGREAGSGTRGAFEELLEIEEKCVYANELDSTGAVMAKAASTKGAIGYVSLDVLDDTVLALNLEGTAPTAENIKAGTYILSRPFVMATMGEISEQSDLVKGLFEYLSSEEGKALIESVGLITVD